MFVVAAPLGAHTAINVFYENVEDVVVGPSSYYPITDGCDASLFIAVYITEHQQFLLRAVGPDRVVFVVILELHHVDSAYFPANRASSHHCTARRYSQIRQLDHLDHWHVCDLIMER
ncbi:hypothetical protein D3C78_1027890 [compost metagenome]